nr:uncharacterized protein LOC109173489 [Ipomoea batatas]
MSVKGMEIHIKVGRINRHGSDMETACGNVVRKEAENGGKEATKKMRGKKLEMRMSVKGMEINRHGSDMETDGGNVVRKKQKLVAKSTKKMMGKPGGGLRIKVINAAPLVIEPLQLIPLGENHFALVEEGYRLVVDAWLVLSVPAQRALFDVELKMNPKFRSGSETRSQPLLDYVSLLLLCARVSYGFKIGLKVGMDSWTPFSPLGLGAFAETKANEMRMSVKGMEIT